MDAYILTGSFFVECMPEPVESAIRLMGNLLVESSLRKVKVHVSGDFDMDLEKMFENDSWAYEYFKKLYEAGELKDGVNSVQSVIDLANLKCELYDNVIIVNGSNRFDGVTFRRPNVKVLSSVDALKWLNSHSS